MPTTQEEEKMGHEKHNSKAKRGFDPHGIG
jgi:hypothetical protein